MPASELPFKSKLTGPVAFIVLVLLVFLARSAYTVLPERPDDGRKKWFPAVELSQTGDFGLILSEQHHSARWGVVLPVAAINAVGGPSLFKFYFAPLLLFALLYAMLVAAAWKTWDARMLVVLAVVLFYEPYFHRASTQLMSYVFGACFLVAALWALVAWLEREKAVYLVVAAVLAFLAYGAKETYVFFFPGLFFLLWMRRGLASGLALAGLILVLLGIETLAFNALSDDLTLGRVQFLAEGFHANKFLLGTEDQLDLETRYDDTYYQMVTGRWIQMHPLVRLMAGLFFLGALFMALSRRFRSMDNMALGIILAGLSYTIIMCAVPFRISPLVPLQPVESKYLIVAMPFVTWGAVYAGNQLLTLLPAAAYRWAAGLACALALVYTAYSVVRESPVRFKHSSIIYPDKQWFAWRYPEVRQAFMDGYGICTVSHRDVRSAVNYLTLFADPPLRRDELEVSDYDDGQGMRFRFVHHQSVQPEDVDRFIRGRTLELIDDLAPCVPENED